MKAFGFLSFGHYDLAASSRSTPGRTMPGAKENIKNAVEIAVGADELGVNGAYYRVHHFAPQHAAPMPVLAAAAARTKHIEVGTGVIDLRYENPLHLAEEAAQLDLLSDGRVALGVSRGSPEPVDRGYEAFGYATEPSDPKGAAMAREKFDRLMAAVDGEGMATSLPSEEQYPRMYQPNVPVPVMPTSLSLRKHIWWGAGSRDTAVWAAQKGVNLMSSTLLTEANGEEFSELQAGQIRAYRAAWKEAGHAWTPRVSVSRSIFPVLSQEDRMRFGRGDNGGVGYIDDGQATFGRTYADEPDALIEQLKEDAAVMEADTLMLTIPSQLGVDANLRILQNFAEHVAPALGWEPNTAGPVTGYAI
ncbi:MAG: LLM class flavin-dependent oxidoreductase [Corynebacterium sp.]|nr:LLM class flavin-dependent oxidoreductase [Corynebacterium sp.]MDN5723817.1 LLM class flavin-dependent oxidoreductase [Corynebacterium sp.]MDN6282719.1 LLM class flavin-dependent oxidoreductase [Corynebacterium sp.]MDN6305203.1 LLM class flavin-dependent oxidoreductase [Corynebacterium sp.]MDN6353235.1 LLM class flavin-dependent oxidoreductase [Corynebacterium sp.]MDN6367411.1 LLM class flavin-dependent oxidoreductase [Corynebacterium sp.]